MEVSILFSLRSIKQSRKRREYWLAVEVTEKKGDVTIVFKNDESVIYMPVEMNGF